MMILVPTDQQRWPLEVQPPAAGRAVTQIPELLQNLIVSSLGWDGQASLLYLGILCIQKFVS